MTISRPKSYGQLWFKLALALGAILSILLLIQSIAGYVLVSRRMVSEHVRREAQRQGSFLERSIRQTRSSEPSQLTGILDEMRKESEGRIAWLRIVDPPSTVLVQSGEPTGPPVSLEDSQTSTERSRVPEERRSTAEGEVFVTVSTLRMRTGSPRLPGTTSPDLTRSRAEELGIPPEARPNPLPGAQRPQIRFLEIALYSSSVSGVYWPLRRNLIISISASLALLGAIALIGLRFGPFVRGKQLEQQLELARRVQQDLMPPREIFGSGLSFATECLPAYQVGGDFCDVFPAGKGDYALVLGDVSGKGLPAALLMGLLHGSVRSSAWVGAGAEYEAGCRRLNELLCTRTSPERHATLFLAYVDPTAHQLRYVNAGHPPPLVVRSNGSSDPEVVRLAEGGPVLGLLPGAQYREGRTDFQPGDMLVLYSDGITDATNRRGEEYGEERLWESIRLHRNRPAAEVRTMLVQDVQSFMGAAQLADDMTLVIARVDG